jgi:hypothetical protein
MIQVTIKGLNKLPGALKKEREREGKALNTAIRVAGFARMKELKAALMRGRGIFEPLSFIARSLNSKTPGRMASNRPLAKMAVAVGYHVFDRDPIGMAFGFTGPKLSKSWRRIARFQQEGGTRPVTPGLRKSLIGRAAALSKRSAARRYLFIKKSTTTFETPPRPIIEPFWRSKKDKTRREVIENFRRKLRGERI